MVFVWYPARKLKISGHGERGKGIQHSHFFGHFCYKPMSSDKKRQEKPWQEICPNFVVVVASQNTKLFWQNEDNSVIRAKNRKQFSFLSLCVTCNITHLPGFPEYLLG